MAYGIEITQDTKKVYVGAPFNARFVTKARTLGGKWIAKKKLWSFPIQQTPQVLDLCLFLYGTDGSKAPDLCTIRVKVGGEHGLDLDTDELIVGGRTLLRRPGRDMKVIFAEGVVLVGGPDFPRSGGSVMNPRIDSNDVPRELLMHGFSRPLAESLEIHRADVISIEPETPIVRLPSPAQLRRESLEAEAKTLRARLAVIEAEIQALDAETKAA